MTAEEIQQAAKVMARMHGHRPVLYGGDSQGCADCYLTWSPRSRVEKGWPNGWTTDAFKAKAMNCSGTRSGT